MTERLQLSFNQGEVSPSMYARSDLQWFRNALAKCRNCIVLPTGGVESRGGLEFIGYTESDVNDAEVRIIPFEYDATNTYLLEFNPDSVTVWSLDGSASNRYLRAVANVGHNFSPISKLTFSRQNSTTLQIVGSVAAGSSTTRELVRTSHTSWAISNIDIGAEVDPPGSPSITNIGTTGSRTISFRITAIDEDTGEESIAAQITTTTANATQDETNFARVDWLAPTGNISRYNIYKRAYGANGVYGYIASTEGLLFDHTAEIEPVLAQQPPEARNPFSLAANSPVVGAFHQQRRIFANTPNNTNRLWASATGYPHNHNLTFPVGDSDPFYFDIETDRLDEIRYFISLNELLMFTAAGEYLVTGAGLPLSPTNFNALRQSSWGIYGPLHPLSVGDAVLFAQRGGTKIRDFVVSEESSKFFSTDITILASHLFGGKAGLRPVSWAYQKEPYSVVWVVMSDGSFYGLTYVREHKVWAWHRHDTPDGSVKSVAVVPLPDGSEEVYFVVERTLQDNTFFIERLHVNEFADTGDDSRISSALSLDCSYGDLASNLVTITFSSGTQEIFAGDILEGATSGALCTVVQGSAATSGTILVRKVEGTFTATETLRSINRYPTVTNKCVFDSSVNAGLSDRQVWDAEQLGGVELVAGLSDGQVFKNLLPASLQVDFGTGNAGDVVRVGLAYTAYIATLPVPDDENSEPGERLNVGRVEVKTQDTAYIQVGRSLTELTPVKFRDGTSSYTGSLDQINIGEEQIFDVLVDEDWVDSAQVFVVQDNPLPMKILSLDARWSRAD